MSNKKRFNFKVPQWSLVEVIWQDAYSSGGDVAWKEKDEPHETAKAAIMHTTGFLFSYTKRKTIGICRSFCPHDFQREGDFVIPIGCIQEFIVYKKFVPEKVNKDDK
jgi:hypothetical protein